VFATLPAATLALVVLVLSTLVKGSDGELATQTFAVLFVVVFVLVLVEPDWSVVVVCVTVWLVRRALTGVAPPQLGLPVREV
jgi:hypothetical protein